MRFLWALLCNLLRSVRQLFTNTSSGDEQLPTAFEAEQSIPQHWIADCERIHNEAQQHNTHTQITATPSLKHGTTQSPQHQHKHAPRHWLADVQRIHQQHINSSIVQNQAQEHQHTTTVTKQSQHTKKHSTLTNTQSLTDLRNRNATALVDENSQPNHSEPASTISVQQHIEADHNQSFAKHTKHSSSQFEHSRSATQHTRHYWQASAPNIHSLQNKTQVDDLEQNHYSSNNTEISHSSIEEEQEAVKSEAPLQHVETHIAYAQNTGSHNIPTTKHAQHSFSLKRIIKRICLPSKSKAASRAQENTAHYETKQAIQHLHSNEVTSNHFENLNIIENNHAQHSVRNTNTTHFDAHDIRKPQTTAQQSAPHVFPSISQTQTSQREHSIEMPSSEYQHNMHRAPEIEPNAHQRNLNAPLTEEPDPSFDALMPDIDHSAKHITKASQPTDIGHIQLDENQWPQLDDQLLLDGLEEAPSTPTDQHNGNASISWRQTWSV